LQNRFARISKYWCMVDLALQPNQLAITDRRYSILTTLWHLYGMQ
jgi:hypothetical protein